MAGTQWWEGSTQTSVHQPPAPTRSVRRGPWPRATEYTQAIQDPARVFSDPILRNARVETTMLGLPAAATGQNAIVFKVLAQGEPHAVRCFTPTQGEPSGETYKRLSSMQLPAVMVPARWIENGIRVKQQEWPVLAMPWIAGDTLNIWLAANARDRARVLGVRDALRAAYAELRRLNVVHGDLHHGNIIITPRDEIRLVDFDGVCIFGTSGDAPLTPRPTEVGHPNYQHPQRIRHGSWHRYTDTFAALVIDVSLSVIAAQPSQYSDTGDSLFFTRDDLESPGASKAFRIARSALAGSSADLRLAYALEAWCARQERADIGLSALAQGHDLPPAAAYSVVHDGGQRKSDRVASDWTATNNAPRSSTPKTGVRPKSPSGVPVAPPLVGANTDGWVGFGVVLVLLFVAAAFFSAVGGSGGSSTAAAPRPAAPPSAPVPTPRPAAPAPAPPRCTQPESRPTISQGSSGIHVRALQQALLLRVDGVFGQQTARAVRSFQAAQGLRADGVVGQRTWLALGLVCPGSGVQAAPSPAPAPSPPPSNLTWKVGACIRQSEDRLVDCSGSWDAQVVLATSNPNAECPLFLWPKDGLGRSWWYSVGGMHYCIAPSLSASRVVSEVGACLRDPPGLGGQIFLVNCNDLFYYRVYAVVPVGAECPEPPIWGRAGWVEFTSQNNRACYQ
jgi:serine/threonine protein kinase